MARRQHCQFSIVMAFSNISISLRLVCSCITKPMDSFGTWPKLKLIYFLSLQNFIELYSWTINALLTVRSEMQIFQFVENNQNIQMFGVPPNTLPFGYLENDNLPLGNIALQYVIQNNCRKIWLCFLMIFCTFWRSRKNLLNSPKLSCGFNVSSMIVQGRAIFFNDFFQLYSHEFTVPFIFCKFMGKG